MDKTPSQCREKIKKLKTIYRNLNNGNGKVSRKIRGRLIHKLHQVMGGISMSLPSTSDKEPEMVVPDAGQVEIDNTGIDRQRTNVLNVEFASPFQTTLESGGDFLADGDTTTISSDPESVSSSEVDQTEVVSQTATKCKVRSKKPSRRKKGSRSKKRSAIYVLIDKVIAAQSAANERFAALEER